MLERLDKINWHKLEHAYGAADDVPEWLRTLAFQDENDALTQLSLSLCHQGTVYSASAHAVLFLIELLTSETMRGKEGLMRLLADMAQGNAYHYQHLEFYPEARRQDPAFQRELAEEVKWVERTREAVRRGLPIYLGLLADTDPNIRMNVAYTLAQLKADAAVIVPLLCSRFPQEDNPQVRASMLLSLGVLSEPTAETCSLLEPLLRTEGEHTLIRFAAAVSLARLLREETPEAAVRVLVDLLTENVPAWLFEVLETVDDYDVDEIIRTLLYVAFGHSQLLTEQVTIRDLTEKQRAVLWAIAESHASWHTPPGVYGQMGTQIVLETSEYIADSDSIVVLNDDLQKLGLPSTQHDLLDFLH